MSRYLTTNRPYLSISAVLVLVSLADFIAGRV